jgi:hypothetical protein
MIAQRTMDVVRLVGTQLLEIVEELGDLLRGFRIRRDRGTLVES